MHKPWHQRSMMKYNVGGSVPRVPGGRRVMLPGTIEKEEIITVDDQGRPLFLVPSKRGGHSGKRKDLTNIEKIECILSNLPDITREATNPRGRSVTKRDYRPLGILGLNVNEGLFSNQERDRAIAQYLQENPDRYTTIMERFDGDINKLSEYLSSDEVTEEDIELFNPELTENLEIASGTTDNPDQSDAITVSTEEKKQTDENTKPTPEEPKEETVEDFVNRMSTESFIDRSPEYRPEAKRAGNVAQMYGEIAPGQVGGVGPGLSRGARTAELRQQGIEDKEREYEKERAIEMAKLAAEPKYGKLVDFKLGPLGDSNLVLQKYVSKTPGSRDSLAAEGSAAMVVNEVYNGMKNINAGLSKINWLKQNADGATGGPAAVKSFAEKAAQALGISLPAGQYTTQKAVVDFLQLEYAKQLLGEGGKTISNEERQMVKQALGTPGVFNTVSEMLVKLGEVEDRLNRNLKEHERFINNAAAEHPSINDALITYQENIGVGSSSQKSVDDMSEEEIDAELKG